ncbi:hypothetical protein SDC9_183429 [bioreactor metagenome]|uniref:Uncharacterized protein n=1 Tax=bioreactor metagenome TaxID=1076179 RepID=A0A645HBM6_9ZZZZ
MRPLNGNRRLLGTGHRSFRNDGGDGVLVDDLLLSLRGEDDDEGVEPCDVAAKLEAVHKKHGDGLSGALEIG